LQCNGKDIRGGELADNLGISIFDTAGKRIPVSAIADLQATVTADGLKVKCAMVCKQSGEAGDPAKIAIRGAYSTTVEAPFAFTDVALR